MFLRPRPSLGLAMKELHLTHSGDREALSEHHRYDAATHRCTVLGFIFVV